MTKRWTWRAAPAVAGLLAGWSPLAFPPSALAQATAEPPPEQGAAPAIAAKPKPKTPPAPAETIPGGRTGPQGVPQAIRWTENWSAAPGADAPLLERIKHIPIGDGNVYLSRVAVHRQCNR